MFSETSLIWRLVTMNWLSFLNCANPGLFSLFSLTVCVQYKVFANDWIWTADFWSRKRLLYQLSHNHCLNRLSFKLGLFVVFRPLHNPMSLSMPQFYQKTFSFFKKMGQSRPLFCLFSSFQHDTNQYKLIKA